MLELTRGIWHHSKDQCDGPPCCFHSPSLHAMVEEEMVLDEDWDVLPLIHRLCKHGQRHPDPDSLAWLEREKGIQYGEHECDGCCRMLEDRFGSAG